MQTLWRRGPSSIRELLEAFPDKERLAYTTVQTVVNRLEAKTSANEKISTRTRRSPCGGAEPMIDELVA
jgi:predicted transcriptional regulator